MTLLDWLNEPHPSPVPVSDGIPGELCPTKLQVYAALVAKNGFYNQVCGWGVMQGGGLYGTIGLEQEEGLALMWLGAFCEGWAHAEPGAHDAVTEAMESEWDRVKALRDDEQEGRK